VPRPDPLREVAGLGQPTRPRALLHSPTGPPRAFEDRLRLFAARA
jgi:hypothetical protein